MLFTLTECCLNRRLIHYHFSRGLYIVRQRIWFPFERSSRPEKKNWKSKQQHKDSVHDFPSIGTGRTWIHKKRIIKRVMKNLVSILIQAECARLPHRKCFANDTKINIHSSIHSMQTSIGKKTKKNWLIHFSTIFLCTYKRLNVTHPNSE